MNYFVSQNIRSKRSDGNKSDNYTNVSYVELM